MLTLPCSLRIFCCTEPVDMRKSFDGLLGLVEDVFQQDILDGHLFVFVNRRRDRMKMLYFDRDGLAIWYKRLEPPRGYPTFEIPGEGQKTLELSPSQLAMLLGGVELKNARQRKRYCPPA